MNVASSVRRGNAESVRGSYGTRPQALTAIFSHLPVQKELCRVFTRREQTVDAFDSHGSGTKSAPYPLSIACNDGADERALYEKCHCCSISQHLELFRSWLAIQRCVEEMVTDSCRDSSDKENSHERWCSPMYVPFRNLPCSTIH